MNTQISDVFMRFIAGFLFYLMMFFRTPILFLTRVLGSLLFLYAIILVIVQHHLWYVSIIMVVMSFLIFVLRHKYDEWLLELNPSRAGIVLMQ